MNKSTLINYFDEHIKTFDKTQKTSINKYKSALNILKEFPDELLLNPEYFFDNCKLIKTEFKESSIKDNFLKQIRAVLNKYHYNDIYTFEYKQRQELWEKLYNKHHCSPKKVKIIQEKIEKKELKSNYIEFIKSLYTNYPPLRSDYFNVKLNNYDENVDNYIKDNELVINKFVKVPRNSKRVIYLNNIDTEFIKDYSKTNDVLYDGCQDSFKRMLLRDTCHGVQYYRHSYCQKIADECKNKDIRFILAEFLELSTQMNTSIDKIVSNYLNNEIAAIDDSE
jgi:hypothetical protein